MKPHIRYFNRLPDTRPDQFEWVKVGYIHWGLIQVTVADKFGERNSVFSYFHNILDLRKWRLQKEVEGRGINNISIIASFEAPYKFIGNIWLSFNSLSCCFMEFCWGNMTEQVVVENSLFSSLLFLHPRIYGITNNDSERGRMTNGPPSQMSSLSKYW